MRGSLFVVAALGLICSALAAPALTQLGPLPVNQTSVAVSGLSSGGFMAVQFHVAFSSIVDSAGIIAGGPYFCAAGDYSHIERCMAMPEMLDVNPLIAQAIQYAKNGDIDDLANLADDRVWLYSCKVDTLVRQGVMEKLDQFYQHFVSSSQITKDFDQMSQHGFPTLDYGVMCEMLESPFILKCNYDGAGKILQSAYGHINPPVQPNPSNLLSFDASIYGVNSNLLPIGYIYVPTGCRNTSSPEPLCRLHVAFHGCEQSYEYIDTKYVENTGYNAYAESNNIVVLYPQAAKNPEKKNPNGCFDWWGVTDQAYATKTGPQMAAVKNMVDAIIGK